MSRMPGFGKKPFTKLKTKSYEATTWICVDCAKGRYLAPLPGEGHIHEKFFNCDYCAAYKLCLDLDDLIPPWE